MKTYVPEAGDLVIFHDWKALIHHLYPTNHSFWHVTRWKQGDKSLGDSEKMVLCLGFAENEKSGKLYVRFYETGKIYEFKLSSYAEIDSAITDSIIFSRIINRKEVLE